MKILLVAYPHAEQMYLNRGFREGTDIVSFAQCCIHVGPLLERESVDALMVFASGGPLADLYDLLALIATRHERPLAFVTLDRHTNDAKERLMQLGASACYISPYSFTDLYGRLQLLHRVTANLPRSLGSAFPLSLDAGRRELREGTRQLMLTRREFLLLECLFRTPNTPVGKQEIFEHAYLNEKVADGSSVNLAIYRLRAKIRESGFHCRIDTVTRMGYQITVW